MEKTLKVEYLEEEKKHSDREVKLLNDIQKNMQLAYQQKIQIASQNHQSYVNNIQFENQIIQSHNNSLLYAQNRGIVFWRSSVNSYIYYRINPYTKSKKLNSQDELYSYLGLQIHIYDTLDKVKLFDLDTNILLFVSAWFTEIESEVFYLNNLEWIFHNNLQYKNTFQYTRYLQKRNIVQEIQQIQQLEYNNSNMQNNQPLVYAPTQYQQPQLFYIYPSVQPSIPTPSFDMQSLQGQLKIRKSLIINFIQVFSKDDVQFNYIMNWLAVFFQTLQKPYIALVLIGDIEVIDIFINNIIKPIFAYKNEYFCTVNDDMLKKKEEAILKDRIFYHVDTHNLSNNATNVKILSRLLRRILKSNSIQDNKLPDNPVGNIIITASKDSPYDFLKDIYSQCTVFQVKSLDGILNHFKIDHFALEEFIENDLDNFARILATYRSSNTYFIPLNNDEKNTLAMMKNGILLTPELTRNIEIFIECIKAKNLQYFLKIKEKDLDLYEELEYNFKENMIAQPLLSRYFNLVHDDIIFLENTYLLEILKEKSTIFAKTPDDKSKYNGKKRYLIIDE